MPQPILVLFESNIAISEETLLDETSALQRRFCDVSTIENVKKNPSIVKEYQYLVDCTFDNKFYMKYLKNKQGQLIKGEFPYIKTATNKIIVQGPNISRLTAGKYSQSEAMKEKVQQDIQEYDDRINFLISKEPKLKNILNYEEGMKTTGIDVTSYIKSNNSKKIYKLINNIPEKYDENIVYITPNEIEILKAFVKYSENIK